MPLGLAGTLLVLGSVRPAAGASAFSGTFAASSSADGLRVTLVQPGITLTKTLIDLGAPSAQASVNSLGESRAFASFPYPGDTVIATPGLLRGAGNLPAPAYPFYVGSDNPAVPKQEAGDGPYRLSAESTDVASKSLANVGVRIDGLGDLGLSRSETSVQSTAEGVTAHARTETSAFSIGPLRIGHVLSVADTVLGQDGLLTRKAETTIVGAMVGSAPVEITAGGITVAGAAGPAADTAPLNEALKGAGITVELLPKGETATGVTSPALRITSQDKSGSAITYVLGRASASVEGTASAPLLEETGPSGTTPETGPEPGPETTTFAEADFPAEAAVDQPLPDEFVMDVPTATDTLPVTGFSPPVAEPEGSVEPAPAPTVRLVPRRAAPEPLGADSKVAIIATRALLNGGDTRPLYGVALVGIGLCFAMAVGLRVLARAARSGER